MGSFTLKPRVRAVSAERYGIADDEEAFAPLAQGWRPIRTWVSVLLRAS